MVWPNLTGEKAFPYGCGRQEKRPIPAIRFGMRSRSIRVMDRIRTQLVHILQALLKIPTVPFRESGVRHWIAEFCRVRGFRVFLDEIGNLVVTGGGNCRRKPIFVFSAHMDHPGFILRRDVCDGTVPAIFYGGVEPEYFRQAAVRVFTREGERRGRVLSVRTRSPRATRHAVLRVRGKARRGDPAMWDLPSYRMRGERLYAGACDDLVGCAAILTMLDAVRRKREAQRIAAVFTVAEEVGFHGAIGLCREHRLPVGACVVSIETSRELSGARLGDGVVIRVGDRAATFRTEVTAFMVHVAKRLAARDPHFRFQRRLMDGGTCEATIYQAFGHFVGAVSVPLKNYHNRDFRKVRIAPECVSLNDVVCMVKLFVEMTRCAGELARFMHPPVPRFQERRGSLGERWFERVVGT